MAGGGYAVLLTSRGRAHCLSPSALGHPSTGGSALAGGGVGGFGGLPLGLAPVLASPGAPIELPSGPHARITAIAIGGDASEPRTRRRSERSARRAARCVHPAPLRQLCLRQPCLRQPCLRQPCLWQPCLRPCLSPCSRSPHGERLRHACWCCDLRQISMLWQASRQPVEQLKLVGAPSSRHPAQLARPPEPKGQAVREACLAREGRVEWQAVQLAGSPVRLLRAAALVGPPRRLVRRRAADKSTTLACHAAAIHQAQPSTVVAAWPPWSLPGGEQEHRAPQQE